MVFGNFRTYVSKLNSCDYYVTYHVEGLRKNLNDDVRRTEIILTIEEGAKPDMRDKKLNAGMMYAEILTLDQASIIEQTIITINKN